MSSKFKFIRFSKSSSGLLLGVVLLWPLESLGEEQAVQQIPQPGLLDNVDAPRDYLSEKFVGFASYMDRFFGDDRNYQESNKTVVQMDLTRVTGYGGDNQFILSARAKLIMPMTERKLNLLVETDPEQNITGEKSKAQPVILNKVVAPRSVALAARYEKAEAKRWHYSADAGIRFQGLSTKPFARARASLAIPMDKWRLKAAETIFWFNTTGTGASTQLDVERLLSEPMLFRASTNGTWLMESQNSDLRQDLSFYHTLDERTALLYQVSAIGVSKPQWQVTDYVVSLAYRYRLHREWMFVEVGPQMHFPKEMNYHFRSSLGIRLEVLFDESR